MFKISKVYFMSLQRYELLLELLFKVHIQPKFFNLRSQVRISSVNSENQTFLEILRIFSSRIRAKVLSFLIKIKNF